MQKNIRRSSGFCQTRAVVRQSAAKNVPGISPRSVSVSASGGTKNTREDNMRLINADALYRIVKTECNKYGKPTICFECGNKVLDLIDNAPTVEPTFGLFKDMLCSECEKRPKGEWISTVIIIVCIRLMDFVMSVTGNGVLLLTEKPVGQMRELLPGVNYPNPMMQI